MTEPLQTDTPDSAGHAALLRRKIEIAHARVARASLREVLLDQIRISLGKVFLEHLGLEATITIIDSRIGSNTKLIDRLQSGLFGLLALPGGTGMAGFDRNFIATAVARLSGAPDIDRTGNRPFTRTDAALAGQVINLFLEQAFSPPALDDGKDGPNFGMQGFEREKAPLSYILDDPQYALLTILASAGEDPLGTLELILPIGCIAVLSEGDSPDFRQAEQARWQAHMGKVAEQARLDLHTVVQHMHMPLSRVLSLKPGETLALPDASLQHMTLEARTKTGTISLCDGQLGALKAHKAFRVTHPIPAPDPESETIL